MNIAKSLLFRTKYFEVFENFSRESCLLHVTIFSNISKEPMMEQNSKSSFPCWKYTRNKFEIFCRARLVLAFSAKCHLETAPYRTVPVKFLEWSYPDQEPHKNGPQNNVRYQWTGSRTKFDISYTYRRFNHPIKLRRLILHVNLRIFMG